MSEPIFFASAAEWRDWLAQHHASEPEVVVGFWKKGSGRPSMTWSESVDEALCFGWIDSVGRRIDEHSHSLRFTPRRPGSIWSAVNIAKVERLLAGGRMTPAGIAAFEARTEARSRVYSYEQAEPVVLPEAYERRLREDTAAAAFFDARPGSYRRAAVHWVLGAKKEETRQRRLEQLVAESAAGRTLKQFTRPGSS